LKKNIAIYSDQIQELENVLVEIANLSIITAEDQTLDNEGSLVDQARFGLTDPNYRVRILSKISQLLSNGTVEDLITIFKALMQAIRVEFRPSYPASGSLTAIGGTPLASNLEIKNAILQAQSEGVNLFLINAPVDYFGFAGDPNAKGFGVGEFSGII